MNQPHQEFVQAETGARFAEQAEQLIVRCRAHGQILLLPLLLALVLAAVCGAYCGSFAQQWQNMGLLAALVAAAVLGCLLPFLRWVTARTTLTTKRVIVRSGFFSQVRQEIYINRVRSLSLRRTLWQRLFGAGNLEIYMIGATDPLTLANIPDAKNFAAALQTLVQQSYDYDLQRSGFPQPPQTPNCAGFEI